MVHRFVEANGLRFHCVTAGEGPLVILLHGFPEFWYSWRRQIPALARAGFTVVAPDLRGYNDSDKPEGVDAYRVSVIVDDVAGIIRAFGHARAYLVGHDWGGVVAYAFALFKPAMTLKLAVLNCPPPGVLYRAFLDGNLEQLRKSWYMFFFQLPDLPEALLSANNFRLLKAIAYAHARPGTFAAKDLRAFTAAFAKPGALTGAINWYRNMFRPGRQVGREFPPITAPTLLVWGTRDHFLGKELTRGIKRYFSGPFRLVYLQGVSHWVQQEAPGRVNRILVAFLQSSHKNAK